MGIRYEFINPNEVALGLQQWMFTKSGGGGGRIEVTSTLRDRTPQPQEEPLDEAEVEWGAESDFAWGNRSENTEKGPYIQTTWNINNGGDPEDTTDPQDLPPITYQWQETARQEKTVRITGPGGAYVDEARAVVSTFRLPPAENGQAQYVEMTFLKFND